jgi:hypothetical protein
MLSGPDDLEGRQELTTGTSPKENSIFEKAAMFTFSKRRKLYEYDPMKDYTCTINRKCPSGKKCITTSSGKEFVVTLTYDVPGNDLKQYNFLRNAQECADKCEGYGSACRSFLFTKSNVLYGGKYYGRCWLKTKKTTDRGYSHTNPFKYGDFYDQVSNTVSHHPNLLR